MKDLGREEANRTRIQSQPETKKSLPLGSCWGLRRYGWGAASKDENEVWERQGCSKGLSVKHTCLPTSKVAHRECSGYKFPREEDGRRSGILPSFLRGQGLGLAPSFP